MIILSAGLFLVTLLTGLNSYFGGRKINWLRDVNPSSVLAYPKVSILIPARNEEKNIAEALLSVLNLDYPNKEILVINDRSTDRTGEILAQLSAQHPQLKVVSIADLPPKWLGKNYALQRGIESTSSELVLFTDADVVFNPDALRRGVTYLTESRLDHLAMLPEIRVQGVWLNLCVGIFGVYFAMFYEPWKAANPRSKRFIGVGGFNLMKRSAFLRVGGFASISLRPDDDVQLGRLIKHAGFRQELVWGAGTSFVEWYASVNDMVRGLEKNMYVGFRYRWWEALAGSLAIFFLNIFPPLMVFFSTGWDQLFFGGTWFYLALAYAFSSHRTGQARGLGVLFPLGAAIHLYMVANAVLKTIFNRGMYWRETFYSLDDLRSQI